MSNTLITILGPTATGKTALAAEVAWRLGGEVISADARQVFRGMDLGTGKDLADYDIHGTHIPYHVIDICSPHEEYNAYRFMGDFRDAFADIVGHPRALQRRGTHCPSGVIHSAAQPHRHRDPRPPRARP